MYVVSCEHSVLAYSSALAAVPTALSQRPLRPSVTVQRFESSPQHEARSTDLLIEFAFCLV